MLWARIVAYVTGQSRTPVAERISWSREPDLERSDQGSTAAFGRGKGDIGGDRPAARTESLGGIRDCREAGYAAGLWLANCAHDQHLYERMPGISSCKRPPGPELSSACAD